MAKTTIPIELSSTPSIVDGGNATAITIDSSENIGIGETSPDKLLHLKSSGATGIVIESTTNAQDLDIDFYNNAGSAQGRIRYAEGAGSFSFAPNVSASDAFIIDYSGNLGLGMTPTTNNISKSISLVNGGSIFGYGNGTYITANSNYNGAWNTVATGVDSRVLLDGNVIFYRSTSASAGSQGTVSESMRIDTSGNVGIGVTPKTDWHTGYDAIQIGESSAFFANAAADEIFMAQNARYTSGGWKYNSSGTATLFDMQSGNTRWRRAVSGSDNGTVSWSDSMFINSSGNVGIGATSIDSDSILHLKSNTPNIFFEDTDDNKDWRLEATSVFKLQDVTRGAEVFRFDSSGNLIVGKTSTDFNTAGFHLAPEGALYSGIQTASASSTYHLRDTTNNTWKFYVQGSGTINATNTSIASLSDERLKENIINLETGLSEVMSLKPRRFDWKEGEGSGAKNVAGFIAQEVETVLPDLIDDFMHDDLEDAKSVKMSDMIPTLVKAIQEQQTIIDNLTTRIETLEE